MNKLGADASSVVFMHKLDKISTAALQMRFTCMFLSINLIRIVDWSLESSRLHSNAVQGIFNASKSGIRDK
jgi:hypothetical protein